MFVMASDFQLRAWRKHFKLTQEELAERLNTSKSVISALENGKRKYNQSWVEDISDVFMVQPHELFLPPSDGKDGSLAKGDRVGEVLGGADLSHIKDMLRVMSYAAVAHYAKNNRALDSFSDEDDDEYWKKAAILFMHGLNLRSGGEAFDLLDDASFLEAIGLLTQEPS